MRLTLVATLVASLACQESSTTFEVQSAPDPTTPSWWGDGDGQGGGDGDGGGGDAAGDGDEGGAVGAEVCDGWDNDQDGETDEGTGGASCTTDTGVGTEYCVNGRIVCRECEPGQTRAVPCGGCSLNRTDVCNDTGRWVKGACDDCPSDPTPTGCGSALACNPGDTQFRRCDTCPAGQDCGSTCIGSEWRCTEDCEWEQVSGCAIREPVCDRDIVRHEPCARCGLQRITCDGCFWLFEPCKDQGLCNPGDEHAAPCLTRDCATGYTSVVRCNENCEWDAPTGCSGCVPGTTVTEDEPCVEGYPGCGIIRRRIQCVGQTEVHSCQDEPLVTGTVQATVLRNDCIYNECTPGETGSTPCTVSDGRCGTLSTTCDANCDFTGTPGAQCVPRPESCVPGTVETRQTSCGPNACGATFEETRTCGSAGCGFGGWSGSRASCPACNAGATGARGCTTADGRCGTQDRICSDICEWGDWSVCQPRPDSCIPGSTQQETVSCGGGMCGASSTITYTCAANGCGWSSSSTSCPDCAAGQTQARDCTTAVGSCGTQGRTCTGSCSWGDWSTCQPRPEACTPGETEDRACTWYCGLPGKEVWECNGCGWTRDSACVPNDSGACVPGERETIGPCPMCPTTIQERICQGDCTWTTTSCPICG